MLRITLKVEQGGKVHLKLEEILSFAYNPVSTKLDLATAFQPRSTDHVVEQTTLPWVVVAATFWSSPDAKVRSCL